MGSGFLPPGFRFHPADEELVGYYLKRQVDGLGFELEVIPFVDLYKFDPWELPDMSFLPKRELEWFFFCPRDRKYPNGSRTNRATSSGYWKATGKDRKIVCHSSVTGYRKTLVFYCGRASLGDWTDWEMHEYRLCEEIPQGSQGSQGAFALCWVIKKNENSGKASNSDREMLSKRVSSSSSLAEATASNELSAVSHAVSSINDNSRNSGPYDAAAMAESLPTSIANNSSSLCLPQDLILDSSKDYSRGQCIVSQFDPQYELSSPPMNHSHQYNHCDLSFALTYPSFIGEVDILEDLSRIGCMSPFTGHESYTRFCRNEDIACEGFEMFEQAPLCRQASGDGSPGEGFGMFERAPLCRQASGDGSPGEVGNLWMQEDNLRIVM